MRLSVITLFALLPFGTTHAQAWQPELSEEICGDGIDNNGDGWIDQESPQDDGIDRYNFTMDIHTSCTEYPGNTYTGSSCSFDEIVQLDPHKERTFAFTMSCGYAGTMNVDAWALKGNKGQVRFDVWSDEHFSSGPPGKGTLCDGELSGPSEDWVDGGSGLYWVGDYEQSGSTAECVTWWEIDITPLP